jgi:hypothetical protein
VNEQADGTADAADDRPGEANLSPSVVADRVAADAEAQVLESALDAHVELVLGTAASH